MPRLILVWDFTNTVINNQPTVTCEDGWGSPPDFTHLSSCHRRSKPMVRIEQAKLLGIDTLSGHRAVGGPDAFMIEINQALGSITNRFLRQRAWEKRAVKHCHLQFQTASAKRCRQQLFLRTKPSRARQEHL